MFKIKFDKVNEEGEVVLNVYGHRRNNWVPIEAPNPNRYYFQEGDEFIIDELFTKTIRDTSEQYEVDAIKPLLKHEGCIAIFTHEGPAFVIHRDNIDWNSVKWEGTLDEDIIAMNILYRNSTRGYTQIVIQVGDVLTTNQLNHLDKIDCRYKLQKYSEGLDARARKDSF